MDVAYENLLIFEWFDFVRACASFRRKRSFGVLKIGIEKQTYLSRRDRGNIKFFGCAIFLSLSRLLRKRLKPDSVSKSPSKQRKSWVECLRRLHRDFSVRFESERVQKEEADGRGWSTVSKPSTEPSDSSREITQSSGFHLLELVEIFFSFHCTWSPIWHWYKPAFQTFTMEIRG